MQSPEAPDPYETANAQMNYNVGTAAASNAMNNQTLVAPGGKQKTKQVGYSTIIMGNGDKIRVPKYKTKIKLSEPEKRVYEADVANRGALGELAGKQIETIGSTLGSKVDFSGFDDVYRPEINTEYADYISGFDPSNIQTAFDQSKPLNTDFNWDGAEDLRRRVEDASLERFNRQFEKDDEAMNAKLAAQGLVPGTEAWNDQARRLDLAKNDARSQAILLGGQEADRLFGQMMGEAEFENAARGQEYAQNMGAAEFNNRAEQQRFAALAAKEGAAAERARFGNEGEMTRYGVSAAERNRELMEYLTQRRAPIDEISALMGGGQVMMPEFADPFRADFGPPDYESQVANNYNQQMANSRNITSGLFGLASSMVPW